MVDAIKNTVGRLDLQKTRSSDTRNASSVPAQATAAVTSGNSVKVSNAASAPFPVRYKTHLFSIASIRVSPSSHSHARA